MPMSAIMPSMKCSQATTLRWESALHPQGKEDGEYALGIMDNRLFVSTYQLQLRIAGSWNSS